MFLFGFYSCRMRIKFLSLTLMLATMVSCVTSPPPIDEYTLARAALESARTVEAAKYSAGNWHQAEEIYKKAEIFYRDKEYDEAKKYFIRAKIAAERAENSARLIRQKTGDVL